MIPYWQQGGLSIYNGDVRAVLAELPDESVQCVVTSPPYWGLRDYGTAEWEGGDTECDHRRQLGGEGAASAKQNTSRGTQTIGYHAICGKCGARRIDKQIGSEPTPESYIETMVGVFREVRRVLRTDGVCFCNMGDSYVAAQGGRQSKVGELPKAGARTTRNVPRDRIDVDTGSWSNRDATVKVIPQRGNLKPKDLCGLPWRLALALQSDGWWLRSAMPWVKRSAMPESATDRPTSALEYMFMLTKSASYYFDMEAVRVKAAPATIERDKYSRMLEDDGPQSVRHDHETQVDPGGRHFRNTDLFFQSLEPPHGLIVCDDELVGLDVTSVGFKGPHYATYPPKLITPLIRAGTSLKGCCAECGAPRERVVEKESFGKAPSDTKFDDSMQAGPLAKSRQAYRAAGLEAPPAPQTTGWRDICNCNALSVPCTVLDPFMGSGTTLLVARQEGCRGIGIELNPGDCARAKNRLAQDCFDFVGAGPA